jgi:uncharacterized protein YraI
MIKTVLISAALAAAALIGVSTAASAADAFTTTNLNVRSGPGTNYAVIGTLGAGTRVHLDYCRDGWCNVEQGILHGWASASHLDKTRASIVIVPPPIIIHRPHYQKPWPPHRPRPPHHKPWPPKPKPPYHKPGCKIAPGFPCK